MVLTPITEPVDKKTQSTFVRTEQNLMFLAEHGMLDEVDRTLQMMREAVEFGETC